MRIFHNTRSSRRVASAVSAHSAMRRPMIGIGIGAALLASAAAGIVFAPAAFGVVPTGAALKQASDVVQDGKIALTNAQAMNGVVAMADVHPGTISTAVDLAELRADVMALVAAKGGSAQRLADLTNEVRHGAGVVQSQATALRDALGAAREAKAAEEVRLRAEAEAVAQAEAQRIAEERAAQAAEALIAANTPEGAQNTARALAWERYGWGESEFSCLVSLWTKESGWNYQAYNEDGGATGIPQSLPGNKMASAGDDWRTNAATQIAWGLDYIDSVYGSPCSAWGHSQAVNWY